MSVTKEFVEGQDFLVQEMGDFVELSAPNFTCFVAGAHWAGRNSWWIDWETLSVTYNHHRVNLFKKPRGGAKPSKKALKE